MAPKTPNPFLSPDAIPLHVEQKILGTYTDLCYELDEQDLHIKYIFKIFSRLNISKKLLTEFNIQDYCLEGTQLIDVDKLCHKLGLIYILNQHLPNIVSQWLSLIKLLPDVGNEEITSTKVFQYKITKKNLVYLLETLQLDTKNVNNMLKITDSQNGVNFVQFAMILGKLNQLN